MTNPASPERIGRIKTPGLVTSVLVSENRLFAALVPFGRIRIYDISNEDSPELIGEFSVSGPVEAMRLDGNDLHAAQHDKLRYAVQCMAGIRCPRGTHVEVFDVAIPSLVTKRGEYDGGEFPAVHLRSAGDHVLVRNENGFDIYAVEAGQ